MFAWPVLPSTVAEIEALPPATPVTTPVDETDAMLLLEELQVTVRPVTGLPDASSAVAVACVVWPTATEDELMLTETDAMTTFVTVTPTLPFTPSTVAVIVAEPAATAVTRPVEETVAIFASDVDQVTVRPEITAPEASFAVADACVVCPTVSAVALTDAVTLVTAAAVTVTADDALLPSIVAVTVAVPWATPLSFPVASTVTTCAFDDFHVTRRPVSVAPLASFAVAVSCDVAPAASDTDVGATATDATATAVTETLTVSLKPPEEATTPAVPTATPLTTPVALTVATLALVVDHAIGAPLTGWPSGSLATAVSCDVWPTVTVPLSGDATTDATETSTYMLAVSAEEPD
jgi:hypothetical protein